LVKWRNDGVIGFAKAYFILIKRVSQKVIKIPSKIIIHRLTDRQGIK